MKKFLSFLSILCIEFSLCAMEQSTTIQETEAALPTGIQEIVLKHYFASYKSYEDKIHAATNLVKKQPQSKAWASLVLKTLCERFKEDNPETIADHLPLILSAASSRSYSMFLVMQNQVKDLSIPDCLPPLKDALFAAAAHGSAKALQFLAETLLNQSEEQEPVGLLDYLHSLHDAQGKTVLMYAAEKGNVPVLLFLAPPKQAPNEPIANENSDPLRDSFGAPEEKTLLYIDLPDSTGKTALILAIEHGNDKAVDALLNGGADPEAMGDGSPWNPLHAAIHKMCPSIVKMLLERDADIGSVCSDCGTIEAAIIPDALIDHHLARRGVDPTTPAWENAFDHLRKQSTEVMRVLLQHPEAPINEPNPSGDYPLHSALRYPELKGSITAMLLAAGADPSLPDRFGIPGEQLLQ
jgi:ankyrin repeat protein